MKARIMRLSKAPVKLYDREGHEYTKFGPEPYYVTGYYQNAPCKGYPFVMLVVGNQMRYFQPGIVREVMSIGKVFQTDDAWYSINDIKEVD